VSDLDEAGKESLERANAAAIPTTKLQSAPAAYWCRVGERTYLRWVLPHDEDAATDALARLLAASATSLGEGTRLLGAFRACGLLVPVWTLTRGWPAPTTRMRWRGWRVVSMRRWRTAVSSAARSGGPVRVC